MIQNKQGQFTELSDNQVQVFTKSTLKRANDRACKLGLNRSIYKKKLNELLKKQDDVEFYPVLISMIHNDTEIRAQIQLTEEGQLVWLDVPVRFWDRDVLTLLKDKEGKWGAK